LGVVGFAFAALGAITPGELGPGLLAVELGVSALASVLLAASLVRLR
jgi:hypothetical protein